MSDDENIYVLDRNYIERWIDLIGPGFSLGDTFSIEPSNLISSPAILLHDVCVPARLNDEVTVFVVRCLSAFEGDACSHRTN